MVLNEEITRFVSIVNSFSHRCPVFCAVKLLTLITKFVSAIKETPFCIISVVFCVQMIVDIFNRSMKTIRVVLFLNRTVGSSILNS